MLASAVLRSPANLRHRERARQASRRNKQKARDGRFPRPNGLRLLAVSFVARVLAAFLLSESARRLDMELMLDWALHEVRKKCVFRHF